MVSDHRWPIDPSILQHNKKATDLFNKDQKGNVVKADKNWPGLVIRNGTGGKTPFATDKRGVALEGYDAVTYFTDGKPRQSTRRNLSQACACFQFARRRQFAILSG